MRIAAIILISLIFSGCAARQQKVGSNDTLVLFNSAHALMKTDRKRAVDIFDEVIRTSPKMWQAHYNKAVLHLDMRRFAEAEDEFLTALKYNRKNSRIYNALGNLYMDSGRQDEALQMLARAVVYDKSGASMMNLANLHQTLGQREKAFELYTKISEEYPGTPLLHYNFAVNLYESGDYARALDELGKSESLKEKGLQASLLEAQIFVKMGKIESALSSLLNLVNRYPKEPAPYKFMGIIYEIYLGDMTSALYNYSRYTDLGGGDKGTVQSWMEVVKAKRDLTGE